MRWDKRSVSRASERKAEINRETGYARITGGQGHTRIYNSVFGYKQCFLTHKKNSVL